MNRYTNSFSDNRKSAIQNPKWLGLSVMALVLVAAGRWVLSFIDRVLLNVGKVRLKENRR
jgi:hypothetical protein